MGTVRDSGTDLAAIAPRWTAETLAAGAGRAIESGAGVPSSAWCLLRSLVAAGFEADVRRGLDGADAATRKVVVRMLKETAS